MTLGNLKNDIGALKRVGRELGTRMASKSDGLAHRVASRWVQGATQSMQQAYDIMLRLQVLEGVAGVKEGTWWKKGKRGLPKARAAFENDPVNPIWFDPGYTRMYEAVAANTARMISSLGLSMDPDEAINMALMGLSFTGSGGRIKPFPYEVGKKTASKIKAGRETPISLGKGPIAAWIQRKLLNIKRDKAPEVEMPEDEAGRTVDFEAPTSTRYKTPYELIEDIVFHTKGDGLGQAIRSQMRKSWTTTKPWSDVMLYWLEQVLQGRPVQNIQLAEWAAENAGKTVSPSSFSVNYWKPAWAAFFNDLWKNRTLIRGIKERLRSEGLDDDLLKPSLSGLDRGDPLSIILPRNRGRRANRDIADRVMARWLDQGIVGQIIQRHAERTTSTPPSDS